MNEYDSVQPAYENGPKEANVKRRMPSSEKQFGKEKETMPQEEAEHMPKHHAKHAGKHMHHRHKEHR